MNYILIFSILVILIGISIGIILWLNNKTNISKHIEEKLSEIDLEDTELRNHVYKEIVNEKYAYNNYEPIYEQVEVIRENIDNNIIDDYHRIDIDEDDVNEDIQRVLVNHFVGYRMNNVDNGNQNVHDHTVISTAKKVLNDIKVSDDTELVNNTEISKLKKYKTIVNKYITDKVDDIKLKNKYTDLIDNHLGTSKLSSLDESLDNIFIKVVDKIVSTENEEDKNNMFDNLILQLKDCYDVGKKAGEGELCCTTGIGMKIVGALNDPVIKPTWILRKELLDKSCVYMRKEEKSVEETIEQLREDYKTVLDKKDLDDELNNLAKELKYV